MASNDERAQLSPPRFEPADVPALLPLWLALLLASFVVGVLIAITLGFPLADHQEYRGPLRALPPAPQLQTAPHRDLRRYHAAKLKELQNPARPGTSIDRAMRATAAEGWGATK